MKVMREGKGNENFHCTAPMKKWKKEMKEILGFSKEVKQNHKLELYLNEDIILAL